MKLEEVSTEVISFLLEARKKLSSKKCFNGFNVDHCVVLDYEPHYGIYVARSCDDLTIRKKYVIKFYLPGYNNTWYLDVFATITELYNETTKKKQKNNTFVQLEITNGVDKIDEQEKAYLGLVFDENTFKDA